MTIPFARPYLTGKEIQYISDLIENVPHGSNICGDGPYSKRCEHLMEEKFGAHTAMLTTSCTSALEIATDLINIGPGDEVIMPSFTFVSTANPVVMAGGIPIFVDIDPGTLNIDVNKIEEAITSRTKAIYPVHYAGVSCAMDEIMAIARKNDLWVVEDAAQGVGAQYKGKYLGTIGDIGCYSFHETKNITCGEGGALLINGNNSDLVERAEIIREKGTDRSKFHKGLVDKYTWVDIGSSYIQSELLSSFLLAQLESMDEINQKRMDIWNHYAERLKWVESTGTATVPHVPDDVKHNAHIFYLILRNQQMRDGLLKNLKEKGIGAVFHYIPLHSSPMGESMGCDKKRLPVTDEMSGRILRLPLYSGLSREDQDYIISTIETEIKNIE
jgi:dTDP-4-amino-4,6-dideoxygalactose transaminase